jgi:NitT/TauT family transport system permease protein
VEFFGRRELGVAAATLIVIALVWEAYVRIADVPNFLLPTPSSVVEEFFSRPQLYGEHLWVTFYETTIGFLAAAALGIFAAIVIVYSRWMQSIVYPIVILLQIVPKVAIAPLLLVWVGYGIESKIIVAVLVAFFPVVVDTVTGLRAVDLELLDLVRVLKGRRWQEFTKVRFPYALPFIFAGLKVAVTLAVIGAIIAEFVGGNKGLGFLIVIANSELNVTMSFAALTLLSLLGLALFGFVSGLEKLLIPWADRETTSTTATG